MTTGRDRRHRTWAAIRAYAPVAAVYLFLALLELRLKIKLAPAWFDGPLESNHRALLAFEFTNNEQSRLLQFCIPEAIIRLTGVSIPHAYMVQRACFVALSYLLLHLYLRKWFSPAACFAAGCLLAAIHPFTFIDDLQESSPFLMASFAATLWVLRDAPSWAVALALLVGAMNNETSLSLIIIFVADRFTRWNLKALGELLLRSTAVVAPALVYTAIIRWITRHQPHLGGALHWRDNMRGIRADLHANPFDYFRTQYLFFIFVFNVLWIYAFVKLADKPRFIRATLWLIPAFVLAHLITGIISEPRQMIPLGFIVIPASMFWLFPPRPDADSPTT